jgi:hypothetical protein
MRWRDVDPAAWLLMGAAWLLMCTAVIGIAGSFLLLARVFGWL